MKKMMMWRQGDVLIIKAEDKPESGTVVPRDKGRVVLAYGEVTGHAHAIKAPAAKLFELATPAADVAAQALGERILRSRTAMKLQHEEHSEISLPAGDYFVRHQREYSPTALRQVAD